MAIDECFTNARGSEAGVGDTLLCRYLLHHADVAATFTLAGGGRALDADDLSIADLGRPGGCFNGAVLLTPPLDWDAVLARIERFFRAGRGQACLWSAWPTPDLRGHGWRPLGHPPLLIRPPLLTDPVRSPDTPVLDVRPVSTDADLADFERVAIDGNPLAELHDAPARTVPPATLLDDERLRFFIGRDGAHPVAVAASITSHGIASFSYAATMTPNRRRGSWRRHAIECLRANPELWMAGVFSNLSRPGAEALGFVPVIRLTLWILDRP